mmetsp:Transcript_26856/g.29716  ORF Transcript_26856/g.29716 Transcript_26856/m.29716 type:complete len:459 (+) Transcript_26856:82-1458(+)
MVRVGTVTLVLVFVVLVGVCIVTPAVAFIGWPSCSCSCLRSKSRIIPCRVGILSATAGPGTVTYPASSPCFWYEEPAKTHRVPSPFGRAAKGVEKSLQSLNWQQLRGQEHGQGHERETQQLIPSFTFEYPGASTFCAYHPGIPGTIRQIPMSLDWDNHVDDKLRLHWLLSTNNTAATYQLAPPTFEVNHGLLASLKAGQGPGMDDEGHWFLKHRLDSKRPRVHPYGSNTELCKRLKQMKQSSWKYFVVQKEIRPPMLLSSGRKFVLRAHVLAWVQPIRDTDTNTLQLFLHSNPLVSENEVSLDTVTGHAWASQPASALVLQSGSRSPSYGLAKSEELSFVRSSILEQMGSTVAAVFQELHTQHPFPRPSNSSAEALYQLYGLDFMLNSSGKVFLLEVNRSPRIATGAMGDAHGCYTELLMQAMQILGVTETKATNSEELILPGPGKFGVWRDIYHATL